jgi:hypothetical protein
LDVLAIIQDFTGITAPGNMSKRIDLQLGHNGALATLCIPDHDEQLHQTTWRRYYVEEILLTTAHAMR